MSISDGGPPTPAPPPGLSNDDTDPTKRPPNVSFISTLQHAHDPRCQGVFFTDGQAQAHVPAGFPFPPPKPPAGHP